MLLMTYQVPHFWPVQMRVVVCCVCSHVYQLMVQAL